MKDTKEPTTAVSWRVKSQTLGWLRELAAKDERPVNWVVNKLLEQARAQQPRGAQQ